MANKLKQKDIPSRWDYCPLSSVTPREEKNGIVDGPFGSNLKTIHYKREGVPIVTSGYVTEGYFYAEDYLYVTKEKFEQEKRSAVRAGDIVMAKIGARCGASAILPEGHETGILSGNALKITVDNKRHNTKFIWSVLWRLYYTGKIHSLRTVGAQPAISMASLKKYKILTPPLDEQNRIIRVLDAWNSYLEKLERKIEIKKNIKKGLMQQLLTGKKRLKGFSASWERHKLSDLGLQFIKGKGLPKNEIVADGRYPCIHYGELFVKYKERINTIYSRANNIEGMVLSRKNDILMPTSDVTPNGLAKASCVQEDDVILGGDILIIRSKKDILNGLFFSYSVRFNKKKIMQLVTGTTVYHLYGSDMKKYKIDLPHTINEQNEIAKILISSDEEIESLEKKKNVIEAQKKFLFNNLFTGKIRTPESMKV